MDLFIRGHTGAGCGYICAYCIETSYATGKSEVIFNDVTFISKNLGIYVGGDSSLTINSGTYTREIYTDDDEMLYGAEGATVVINGGIYNTDPSAYVNTETHTVTENPTGTWTVTGKSE